MMETHLQNVINRLKPVLEKALTMQVSTFLNYENIEALLIISTERKSFTIHILEENQYGCHEGLNNNQRQSSASTAGSDNHILVESLKTRLPDAILLLIKSNFPQNIPVQLSALLYIGLPTPSGKIIIHLKNVDLECTGKAFPFATFGNRKSVNTSRGGGTAFNKKPDPIDEYRPRYNNSQVHSHRYIPPESLAKTIDEILDSDSDEKTSLNYSSIHHSSAIDFFRDKTQTTTTTASSSLINNKNNNTNILSKSLLTINGSGGNSSSSKYSKFVCLSCDKVYEDIEEYRNHVLYHLKDIEKVLASTYVETVQVSGDTKLYVCKMCNTRFESLKTAGGHVRHRHLPNVSTQSSLTCPLCMNKYKCVYDCVYHIKTSHLKEKNYQCRICFRKFAQKCNMTKHMKDAHESECQTVQTTSNLSTLPIINDNIIATKSAAPPLSPSTTSSSNSSNISKIQPPKKEKLERLIVKIKKSSTGQHETETTSSPPPSQPPPPPIIKSRFSNIITPIHQRDDRKFVSNTKMQCLGCSIKFENQQDFNKHIKIHLRKLETYVPSTYAKLLKGTSGHKFECGFCKNRFPSIKSVCLHIAKNHLDMNEIKENRECLVCGLKGRATYDVVKHMEGVHLKEKHTCAICSKTFSRKATWVKHLKEVHLTTPDLDSEVDDVDDSLNVKPPTLMAMEMKDEFENGLLVEIDKTEGMHLEVAADEEEEEESCESDEAASTRTYCQKCTQSFDTIESFKSHIKRYHLNDFEKSQADSYVVKISNDFFHGFQCDICKENFPTRLEATTHATRRHYLAKDEQRQYECPVCSKSFEANQQASNHLRNVHLSENATSNSVNKFSMPNNNNTPANNSSNNNNSNDNRCPKCEKIFSNKWNLTRHLAEIHQKIKRFTCKMCPRTFSRQCDGIKHMQQMHMVDVYKTVDKEEKCTKCNKSYSTVIQLSCHVRAKHTTKRYRCDVCGKKFMFPSEQYVHTNMKHTWA